MCTSLLELRMPKVLSSHYPFSFLQSPSLGASSWQIIAKMKPGASPNFQSIWEILDRERMHILVLQIATEKCVYDSILLAALKVRC